MKWNQPKREKCVVGSKAEREEPWKLFNIRIQLQDLKFSFLSFNLALVHLFLTVYLMVMYLLCDYLSELYNFLFDFTGQHSQVIP